MYAFCCDLCVWCRCIAQVVSLAYKSFQFWGVVRVVVFSVSFWNVSFVCVIYYVAEVYGCVV